jgi:hypothetical protein
MLVWYIDAIRRRPGNWYRWHVVGSMVDATDARPADRNANDRTFIWDVPNLRGGGGRYVFRLRPI